MKWLKRILIALLLPVAVGVALPFFISLDDYIPQIEKEASARLMEPVSIKSVRFTALPLPHITVNGITVGTAEDIKLGKVRVTPDLFSLLESSKVIKSIEIESLTLTQKAIERIPAWRKSPQQLPQVRIESVRINTLWVNSGTATLGPFEARIALDRKGEAQNISIDSRDSKFKAVIVPGQSHYLIDASAKAWTLPLGPPIVFDELTVKGVATLHDLDLVLVSAKLYGGTAHGKMTLGWQNGIRFSGNIDVNEVEMQKISSMLSPKTHVSGKLRAKPVLLASAASADQLTKALRLETSFTVRNGMIHGVDIQKAATGLAQQGPAGGETHFEQLSGHLLMQGGGYRFTQIRITSGALAADGDVNISPNKALSGRINAQVKAMGGSVGVPLNVAGTLSAPSLYPTSGTMAGAAVGTVMLGPGLGTSVGAKVGGWVEGLFDGKNTEKKTKQ